MTDHKQRLEKLSKRGEPLGATVLLEQVGRDIDLTTGLDSSPIRQMPGWLVAAAAFTLVILVGGVWALLSRPGDGPSRVTDSAGITWIDITGDPTIPDGVFAGPGGFTRLLFGGGQEGVQFSPDGESWTDVVIPGVDPVLGEVHASRTRWLIFSSHNTLALGWTSTDGEDWKAVKWPPGLENNVSTATALDDGLFATTRDVFGAGTQHWVSQDGQIWDEVDLSAAGVPEPELILRTSAGLLDLPRVATQAREIEFLISADGVNWMTSRINLPQRYVGETVRWGLHTVERLDAGWVAVGTIESRVEDPVIHAWTSSDGQNWVAAGVPPFGSATGRSVIVFHRAFSSKALTIAPMTAPIAADLEGYISGAGGAESTGELWTTTNGISWIRSQQVTGRIASFVVGASSDGDLVGLWSTRPRQLAQPEIVETTSAPTAPQLEIDPAGLDLQNEIIADGVVTEEEFTTALEGWKRCMEAFGLEQVEYEIDPRGGWGASYTSDDEVLADAAGVACGASYVEQLTDLLNG